MAADLRRRAHAPATPALEVLLLGSTEVRVDGTSVPAGGPLQRGALAMLALAAGNLVSVAELTAGLWGDAPPPSVGGTLRAYLSRLRTGPVAGALTRDAGGYRLDPERCACDAVRFLDRCSETEPDPDRLGAALGLWRGDALADLRHLPFAADQVPRLEAARDAAGTRLAELLVACGRHAEAVPLLTVAATRAPYDEHLAALLARALHGVGRHADALATLGALRRRLHDDLGLEPGPALGELQTAILVHDPRLRGAPTAATVVPPGNVPLPLTSFVGRAADVERVGTALAEARLVTLTGPGGCGKTRLALEAVRRLQAGTGRETWVVELAPLADPALVATTVVGVLGVGTARAPSGLAALVTALQGRQVLLVLDNCEHVVDEVATIVEQLLATCRGLQVLATSREPLGVPGERVLAIGTMTLGTADAPGDAERLLLERTATHGVDGSDPTVTRLAHRICRALDGIPLAIELAAARCTVLSLSDLADRLDDRFAILDHGSRTAQARHRTLAAAIAWSHDLLDDVERAVFASASVFRGGFDLEDLAAVHGGGGAALVGVLGALVDKSMVATDDRVTGTRRYQLLETLREFAQQRSDDATRSRLADAHAAHLTRRAEEAGARLRGFDAAPAWRWIDASRSDLRVAFDHAVATGSPCAPRLVAALGWYAYRRGVVAEGLRWCERVAPLRGLAGADVEAGVVLTEASLSYLAGDHERLPRVVAVLREAEARAGDPTVRALARVYLAYFEAAFGDPAAVGPHLEEATALTATGGAAPWAAAEVAMPRGQYLRAVGQTAEAVRVLREGRAAGTACGHRWAVGSLAWIEAKLHIDRRDARTAAPLLWAGIDGFGREGDRPSTLAGLHTMAAVAALLERHEDGARLLGAVDALGARIGYDAAAMDPVDALAHRALVQQGCSPAAWDDRVADGRAMSFAATIDLARALTEAASR